MPAKIEKTPKKAKKLVGVDESKLAKQAEKQAAKVTCETHAERLEAASKKVDKKQVITAVKALVKHVELFKAEKAKLAKSSLLEDADDIDESLNSNDLIHVQFTTKTTPVDVKMTLKSYRIPLSHSMVSLETDLDFCLIVKDKEEAQKWLADQEVNIKKIISLQQLRTQYQTYSQRRDLFAAYDVFLADDRVVCMLAKALGRRFYNSLKRPVPVRIAQNNTVAGNLSSRINTALSSAYFTFNGTCSTMRASKVSFTASQSADNIMDCIAGSVARIPKGWENLQAIHIKTGRSAALPVYSDLPHEVVNNKKKTSDSEPKKRKVDKLEDEATPAKKQKSDEKETPSKMKESAKKSAKKSVKKSAKKSTKA